MPRRKRFWLINGATHARGGTAVATSNPRRRRKSGTTRKRRKMPEHVRRAGGWKAYMDSIRPGGRRRRNVAKANPRRRRRKSSSRRRRRNPGTAVVALNPRRRRRRRNPDFSARNVMGHVQQAMLGATTVTVGKAVSRLVRDNTVGPEEAGKAVGSLVEIATGVGLGMFSGMILPRRYAAKIAELLAAGAMQGVAESLIKQFQVPILSDALSSDGTQYALVKTDGSLAGYVSARQLANGLSGYGGRGGANERPNRPRSAVERQLGTRVG